MDLLKDLSIDKLRNVAEDAINQVKPKTDVEARVYEVLSHKNWGAASTIMNQIARDTYDYEKFAIITRIMWESVETQRPSAWRVIFKGLSLVEHLVKNGSERCVDDARNHGHILRALHQFNYYEGTLDRGQGVREKSKQLVEMLSDNERVREERQKARKLREKLGATTMTASSAGSSGGYSGGDGWSSAGGGGGGGGYGDGGIDSAGYRGSGRDNYSSGSARGRYDDDPGHRGGHASSAAPTFATVPAKKKSTGTKKKKKKAPPTEAPAPAPEVDLFSFDDPTPAPAPAATANDDDFSGFQSAGAAVPSGGGSADPFGSDPFATSSGGGGGATTAAAPATSQPDPFATPAPAPNHNMMQQQQQNSMNNMNNMANMFGNMHMGAATGGGMMQQQQPTGGMMMNNNNNNIMGGGNNNNNMAFQTAPTPAPTPAGNDFDDDDFGDFAGASGGGGGGQQSSSTPAKSSDPFGSLVSLDGLSKNTKKEDKINQPIVINEAAAQYMQDKQQGVGAADTHNSAKSAAMSFAGIDGLQKSSGSYNMNNSMGMGNMSSMTPTSSMGMNPNVMGSGSNNSSLIGSLDPSAMAPKPAQQPQQQQQQGGMNPQMMQQMMMQNPQMMQQMSGGQQMTPQQQQQLMQQMQMMMMQMQNQGMGGGGNNNNSNKNNMMGGQGSGGGGQLGGMNNFGGF